MFALRSRCLHPNYKQGTIPPKMTSFNGSPIERAGPGRILMDRACFINILILYAFRQPLPSDSFQAKRGTSLSPASPQNRNVVWISCAGGSVYCVWYLVGPALVPHGPPSFAIPPKSEYTRDISVATETWFPDLVDCDRVTPRATLLRDRLPNSLRSSQQWKSVPLHFPPTPLLCWNSGFERAETLLHTTTLSV